MFFLISYTVRFKELFNACTFPLIPYEQSLSSSNFWLTVSKVFAKFRNRFKSKILNASLVSIFLINPYCFLLYIYNILL